MLGHKEARTPHATTISRVLNDAVDIEALEQVVATYFKGQVPADEDVVLDGKALRGTI